MIEWDSIHHLSTVTNTDAGEKKRLTIIISDLVSPQSLDIRLNWSKYINNFIIIYLKTKFGKDQSLSDTSFIHLPTLTKGSGCNAVEIYPEELLCCGDEKKEKIIEDFCNQIVEALLMQPSSSSLSSSSSSLSSSSSSLSSSSLPLPPQSVLSFSSSSSSSSFSSSSSYSFSSSSGVSISSQIQIKVRQLPPPLPLPLPTTTIVLSVSRNKYSSSSVSSSNSGKPRVWSNFIPFKKYITTKKVPIFVQTKKNTNPPPPILKPTISLPLNVVIPENFDLEINLRWIKISEEFHEETTPFTKDAKNLVNLVWIPKLQKKKKWHVIVVLDNTKRIYIPLNLEHTITIITTLLESFAYIPHGDENDNTGDSIIVDFIAASHTSVDILLHEIPARYISSGALLSELLETTMKTKDVHSGVCV
jgi:hypothetical protein